MKKKRNIGSKLFLLGGSTIFTLVLLEVAAQIYLERFAPDPVFRQYATFQQLRDREEVTPMYVPHRYLGYSPTPDYVDGGNRHNSLGFRGEELPRAKPEGEFRIVCIGGSTTYTTMVNDHRLSYPAQLQAALEKRGYGPVKVINAGTGSWSSWESLINLQFRVLDVQPDLVIVYHAINDVHPRLVWPAESYTGDNSGYRITNSQFVTPSVLEQSTLARMALIKFGHVTPHSALARTLATRSPSSYQMEFLKQVRGQSYPEGVFAETSAREMFSINRPVYFRRNLSNMVAICKAQGVSSVLATFAYSKQFPEQPVVAMPEYQSAIDELNDVTRDITTKTDAELFDFAAAFPDDKANYVDGRHVNEQGAELKAKLFADFLIARKLIPQPESAPDAKPVHHAHGQPDSSRN